MGMSFLGEIAKLKDELASKTYTVKSGGGLVELSVNGNGEVKCSISD